ncbi:MAG: nicotinate phosphoribosyltransferase, partial [Acidobacteriota bacterium]
VGSILRGVRLDSGDLDRLSREVRSILDQAGMERTTIMASGDLNEYRIDELIGGGAPIDIFGVGTELSTSRDEPALGGVYKLVEMTSHSHIVPKMKLSRDKATYPNRKQIWRRRDETGQFVGDLIGLAEEEQAGDPLLCQVMAKGESCRPTPSLSEVQDYARDQIMRIPAGVRALADPDTYPVGYSTQLETAQSVLRRELEQHH